MHVADSMVLQFVGKLGRLRSRNLDSAPFCKSSSDVVAALLPLLLPAQRCPADRLPVLDLPPLSLPVNSRFLLPSLVSVSSFDVVQAAFGRPYCNAS